MLSLEVSSYLGGSRFDHARDVAFDSSGNMIIVGGTESPGLHFTNSIVTPGSPEPSVSPVDVFVAKFSPAGSLLWATVVGGPSYDRAYAVEVDADGYIYVAGRAGVGFPVTNGALQTQFMGGGGGLYGNQDAFIFKMRPDGYALEWATYFGGADGSMIRDLALDAQGSVYVSSQHTKGSQYPSYIQQVFDQGPYPQPSGGADLVVAKVKGDGSQLLWGLHLGGTGNEAGESSIRVDPSGNPVVLTVTNSTNIQTTAGAYDRTFNGGYDFYLAKVRADGSGLIFGTYLGGSNAEAVETHHLAVDSEGNVIVAAGTLSANFPIVGGYDSTYNGTGGSGTGAGTNYSGDAVVAKISANGTQLLASTFLGGRYGEQAEGVWLDGDGNVYVAGATFSDNFPLAGGAFQTTRRGPADGFVAKLSSTLGSLLYGTFLGGSDVDYFRAAAVDSHGAVCVVGQTNSNNFPLKDAAQTNYLGATDGVFARFVPPEAVSYSISGRITSGENGLTGIDVELSGDQSQSAVTDAEGNYTFAGLAPGDYTVTASHDGYSFTPPSHTFEAISSDQTGDFSTDAAVHEISGTVTAGENPLHGVTVTLSGGQGGSATTDETGHYSFPELAPEGNYTVTPSHGSYVFTPSSVSFDALDQDETADFTATASAFSISGKVNAGGHGLSGVTVRLTGAKTETTVTDADGKYTFSALSAGDDYTVAPSHATYTFDPSSVTFDDLEEDQAADFTAPVMLFAISGRVTAGDSGLSGVNVMLSGAQTAAAVTDGSGSYSFPEVAEGGDYTVTPSHAGFTFTPQSKTLHALGNDATADFTAAAITYSITGRVTLGANGLGDVTLTLGGSETATTQTDSAGNYVFENLAAGGDYTVAPSQSGHTFTPPIRTFNNLAGNQTAGFSAASAATYSISGRIAWGEKGISGVTVTVSGSGSQSTVTDVVGNYAFEGLPAGGDYVVVPALSDYTFSPVSRTVTHLSADQIVNFSAASTATFSISGRVTRAGAGLSGVSMTLSGSQSAVTVTDVGGNYSFSSLSAGKLYTVTPYRANNAFTPSDKTVYSLTANQTMNFTAVTAHSISGRITLGDGGLSDVTVTLSGAQKRTAVTGPDGRYGFTNLPPGANFTVTASRPNYTFAPARRTFTKLGSDQVADFSARLIVYTISGLITSGGSGISGLTVNLTGARNRSVVTDRTGSYSFTELPPGASFKVTPVHPSYLFTPASRTFGKLTRNQTANFTAKLKKGASKKK